jgi:large subunit ribosomal protein L25
MEEIILKTMLRTDSPKKVRLAGFIPGVLNESDLTSTSVQFVGTELNKIISKHGSNAKIWVDLGTEKKFGFIKEIQKSAVDRKIIHIAIQLVSKDQEIKMLIPIAYHGREELEHRQLQLHVYKAEIDVSGKPANMPDVIIVDISKKESGDTITSADLNLPTSIKLLDAEDEIYAVIKAVKEVIEEEPEEAAAAEVTPA